MNQIVLPTKTKKSGSSKGRKIGRNGAACKMYRDREVRMKNKIRKVAKHLKRQPDDWQAKEWRPS